MTPTMALVNGIRPALILACRPEARHLSYGDVQRRKRMHVPRSTLLEQVSYKQKMRTGVVL